VRPSRLVARPISPLLGWLFKTSKNMCHKPSTCTMKGSATKRAGTSVTSSAESTGLDAPGAGASRNGDSPAYIAMDHFHGLVASFERCPGAFRLIVFMWATRNPVCSLVYRSRQCLGLLQESD